jgi:hypothetical protein
MAKGQFNLDGVVKEVSKIQLNIGGAIKSVSKVQGNIGGAIKDLWGAVPIDDDVCNGGTVITVGSWSNESYVFDNNFGNYGQTVGYAVIGDCVGYDFGAGATKHIRRVRLVHPYSGNMPNSIKVQRSSDNSTWYDVATLSPSALDQTFDLDASTASRYWRFNCNQSLAASEKVWAIAEAEMMEAA